MSKQVNDKMVLYDSNGEWKEIVGYFMYDARKENT